MLMDKSAPYSGHVVVFNTLYSITEFMHDFVRMSDVVTSKNLQRRLKPHVRFSSGTFENVNRPINVNDRDANDFGLAVGFTVFDLDTVRHVDVTLFCFPS